MFFDNFTIFLSDYLFLKLKLLKTKNIKKIAKFLFDNESILINLKQVKIAQILNITPETFSRKLAK